MGPDPDSRVAAYFAARGWAPLPFQREVWAAYRAGRSGLVYAPTGTGKTLAALLGPVLEALAGPSTTPSSLTLLWITPLRALATDLEGNIAATLAELDLPWRVERRTGDTGSSTRARQRTRLPTVLITTPESLALLLSYPDTAPRLADLRAVVVDEWHELLGSKRGVLLELTLARLRRLSPALRLWGLSATLGNLSQAMAVLLGPGREGVLVDGQQPRRLAIDALIPDTMERFPWVGHLGLALLPRVVAALEAADSTLLFTNTRSQAELWYQGLLVLRPGWEGEVALHHGSLDRALRRTVEDGLRAGRLRCVVCTASLDLGVDFSPVAQVIQVGSPRGVGRLLQRAGRSGHRPGAISRVLCVPTHALELAEIAAVREAALAGRVESRAPPGACMDVLIQHLVNVALSGGFRPDELLPEIRDTHAYRDLDGAAWRWALAFIHRGGAALGHYPQYCRVAVDEAGVYRVQDRTIARRHRLGIGTIVDAASLTVRFLKGGVLGHIDEGFVARLKPGDRFVFAGRLLALVWVRDMTAYVRLARGASERVPRWVGTRLPFSGALAEGVLRLLARAREGDIDTLELAALAPVLAVQSRWSRLPGPGELLVERVATREGMHVFLYPFAGRRVHEGLGALLAYRLGRERPATFGIAVNDYGIELLGAVDPAIDETRLRAALQPAGLHGDLRASLNFSELARRQFREIARVAGLVFRGYPGVAKGHAQLQASSGLIHDVLARFDTDNLLLDQAREEVLARQLEAGRLHAVLAALADGPIRFTTPPRLTPLAFPLWSERVQFQISNEDWKTRVQRMVAALEAAADA